MAIGWWIFILTPTVVVAAVIVYRARKGGWPMPTLVEGGRFPRLKFMTISLHMVEMDPECYIPEENGLEKVGSYVSKLQASTAPYSSLLIGNDEKNLGLCLTRREAQTEFLYSDDESNEDEERNVRKLFADRDLTPLFDYTSLPATIWPSSLKMRSIHFPIPDSPVEATGVCREILSEIYGVTDKDGLTFKYKEN